MDINNISSIKRNFNGFQFVDALGSFINNIQFKQGYSDYAIGRNNQRSNIWNALSAISEDYAETIYENILNYLDNAANVDLCKVKALQSMVDIVGIKYDIFNSFKNIPIELANLIDILSINKSYILQSNKFADTFISLLSTDGVIQENTISDNFINDELNGNAVHNVKLIREYISDENWKKFLLQLYQMVLNKYVFLQYADAENGLETEHKYIYEYIQSDILGSYNPNTEMLNNHQKELMALKLKYNLSKSFDCEKIVDDIENGYDSIENYNAYQQEVIKSEIIYRENTYSYAKRYTDANEKFLGYNLTRYSYYREKKVKEYFQYIENTYNNMILESEIKMAVDDKPSNILFNYDKDNNYIVIEENDRKQFLEYDSNTKTVEIKTSFINQIANLLVDQTLEIANIREQIKTQIRKSYMRGTFLLMSYAINEFLKFGIQEKYGMYFTTDDGVYLSTILQQSINSDNIELIEYYDQTEYFNITSKHDQIAKNGDNTNEKFWDNEQNKIGINTEDIPLNEIEDFYLNQLKLKKNSADNIVNFLSILYEYGSNNESFISKENNQFTCELSSGQLITNLSNTIIDDEISTIQTFYDKSKQIYLKYNGTQIGYDPFYNHKNITYSSYQIHPYLYNFIEKTNLISPLANNFYATFAENYEYDIYSKTIDDIIGNYGNIINLWKTGLFDWTGYTSLYEKRGIQNDSPVKNENVGYIGLFYPPALSSFMEDPVTFIYNAQNDMPNSYYHHLNLGIDACNRIAEQLTAYYDTISSLVQFQSTNSSISNEYDIYKYAEDANGNQLFLLKSYAYLYEQHKDDVNYRPSYNEKKNTLGELWMRIKDHPIAFPAFDIRVGCQNISQYAIENSGAYNSYKLNQYIFDISKYFSECSDEIKKYTKDLLSRVDSNSDGQYLRCFFDFELSPTNRSILLNVPYMTGTNHFTLNNNNKQKYISCIKYKHSSVIVAYLHDAGLDNDGIHKYNFTGQYVNLDDDHLNIDNIANPSMLINNNIVGRNHNIQRYYEFVGFAKNNYYIYAIYVEKNKDNRSFKQTYKNNTECYLTIRCSAYRLGSQLKTTTIKSDKLKYDIYVNDLDINNIPLGNKDLYENASNVVLACDENQITIGFLTERISPKREDKYLSASTIVNFAGYSQMHDKYSAIVETGLDKNYPTSTAFIQTDDIDRINIYNSFDSFVQHLVNVTFAINGTTLKYKGIKYFNLNSDLGYLPQYPDVCGNTKLYANQSLSNKQQYSIQLLGPEKSDIPFTPIITDTSDEKYGRVTEDYKDYNQIISYSPEIIIEAKEKIASYDFVLANIFPQNEWNTLTATDDLLRYKYIVYNTNYEAQPIAKGDLSCALPIGYYYSWEEKYDILSGEEIIGPNQIAYQNSEATNHIDNISAIQLSIEYNTETRLPQILHLSCIARIVNGDNNQIIPKNTFRLMIYAKNNTKSYEYYHLFENANKNLRDNNLTVSYNEQWNIDFDQISALSDYSISNTNKKPFSNLCAETDFNKLSAMLEFKYSENDIINREYPYLDNSNIGDIITVMQNDTKGIYYISLDDNKSIERRNITLNVCEKQSDSTYKYVPRTIKTMLPQYDDFYDRALTIEATYNIEKINNDKYGIVLYFNYKNFTNPSYIKFEEGTEHTPSHAIVHNSIDKEIEQTYLAIKPGEGGVLDIRVDYAYYGNIIDDAISEQITGHTSQILKRYYIVNVSDNKPKFIISRKPFNSLSVSTDKTKLYELRYS